MTAEQKEPRRVIQLNVDDLVEVELEEDDDFLKVRETLTRIGVSSRKEKTLFQSCHILHKKGRYYIVHFKELFALDGKPTNINDNDIARRNTITNLLAEWGLVSLTDSQKTNEPTVSLNQIKIIAHRDKSDWDLQAKYNIGKRIN
ncbi:MAG: translational repressor RegA [Candidatus Marinimicrobia bacterium]|nr:translational repressor RegA [Candidatus Neomarinimicrobiota bacterium]